LKKQRIVLSRNTGMHMRNRVIIIISQYIGEAIKIEENEPCSSEVTMVVAPK
jgi:hypothetical protein